jgi:hypothetical protein
MIGGEDLVVIDTEKYSLCSGMPDAADQDLY